MSVAFALPPKTEPSADEREHLRRLVSGIVLAQGNLFIKELLRSKQIKIGATKADFERNLLQAIDDGRLQLADVNAWLDEVEGWGDQHVYLFNVPPEIKRQPSWSSAERVRAMVHKAGLGELWDAETSHAFPEEPTLTGISYEPGAQILRLVWHKGSLGWVRVKDLDRQEVIDGDLYEFRAFRQRATRTVMRFEMRLQAGLAALFLSIRLNDPEHEIAVDQAQARSAGLFNLTELWKERNKVLIASVIKKLDQEQTQAKQPSASPESVRLASGGSYVEFASFSAHRSYLESKAVSNVRQAIRQPQLQGFDGVTGIFEFQQSTGMSRNVRVQLSAEAKTIRLWQRMTATDVWRVLETLRDYQ